MLQSEDSSMYLLHCAETIKGGVASYLRELLPLQVKEYGRGRVGVVIPASQADQIPVFDGVEYFPFDDAGSRLGNALVLARMVMKVTGHYGPRVVHLHSSFAGGAVRPLLWLFRKSTTVIYCAHGWAWDRPMGKLGRWLVVGTERLLSGMCHSIVCISDHEYRSAVALGLPQQKMVVVLNGIGQHRSAQNGDLPVRPPCRLRVLFVGRLDRQKGIDVLKEVLLVSPDIHAVVAGGAVLQDSESLVWPKNATYVGWVDQARLEVLLSDADVLVMPSRWEGFGLTALEAMRAGVAVVASRVGGLPEIIVDGETGVLVEPERSSELKLALDNHSADEFKAMGAAGLIRFKHIFTIDRVHHQLCKVYEEALLLGQSSSRQSV